MITKSKQVAELENILNNNFRNDKIAKKFIDRLKEGKITKDEDSKSHVCAYFAAYDPKSKQVFIGHHKKSGLWLFNGGHIDKGETITETIIREISEEWGLDGRDFNIKPPALLTITEIDNPTKQPCNFHYDLWNFILVDENTFNPIKESLSEEFYETGWKTLEEAKNLIKEPNTLLGVGYIENNLF